MLESQFDALVEPLPSEAIFIDIKPPVETVLLNIQEKLHQNQGTLMPNTHSTPLPYCHDRAWCDGKKPHLEPTR